jgi:hypothetical protein
VPVGPCAKADVSNQANATLRWGPTRRHDAAVTDCGPDGTTSMLVRALSENGWSITTTATVSDPHCASASYGLEFDRAPAATYRLQLMARSRSSIRATNDAAMISESSNGPAARTAMITPSEVVAPKSSGSESMASRVTEAARSDVCS